MRGITFAILRRDLRLFVCRGSEGVAALFFFVMTAALFALALGGSPELLGKSASAVLWMAVLLSSLLSVESVYQRDIEDGTFDLLLVRQNPYAVIAAKILSHWLSAGAPLVLAALLMSLLLSLPAAVLPAVAVSLLCGTLYASLLGALGAALTAGSRRPGVLLGILLLPLFVPMLLLGVALIDAALAGLPWRGFFLLQAALLVAALPLSVFAAGAILNMHLRS